MPEFVVFVLREGYIKIIYRKKGQMNILHKELYNLFNIL